MAQLRGRLARVDGRVAMLKGSLAEAKSEATQLRGLLAEVEGEVTRLRRSLAQVEERASLSKCWALEVAIEVIEAFRNGEDLPEGDARILQGCLHQGYPLV